MPDHASGNTSNTNKMRAEIFDGFKPSSKERRITMIAIIVPKINVELTDKIV